MKHSFETNDEKEIFKKVCKLADDTKYEKTNYLKAWKENWESLVSDYPNALATTNEVYNFEKNVAIATINDTVAAHSESDELHKKLHMDDIGGEYIPLYYQDEEDNLHLSFELYFDNKYDIVAWDLPQSGYNDVSGIYFENMDEALSYSISHIRSYEIDKANKAEYEAEIELEKKKSSKKPKP